MKRPEEIPFTPRSKKILLLAQKEAAKRDQNWVGSGHILLGMIVEREGKAPRALIQAGWDYNTVSAYFDQEGWT